MVTVTNKEYDKVDKNNMRYWKCKQGSDFV